MAEYRVKRLFFLVLMVLLSALPLTAALAAGSIGPDTSDTPSAVQETNTPEDGEQLIPGTVVDGEETQGPGSGAPADMAPGSAAARPLLIGLMVILVAAAAALARSVYKKDKK